MDYYQTAQICLNGHCITSTYEEDPLDRQPFCDRCGSKTITECPSCHAKIRGTFTPKNRSVYFGGLGYRVPSFCDQCGAPFPWTQSALETATALIQEDDQLLPENQTSLVEVLPDIIAETPRTQLAVVRLKKALAAAGKFTAEGLRQFALDFACELAKKQLGI